jgi:hemerythrin
MAVAPTFPDGILAQHAYVAKLVGALREAQTEGARPTDLMARLEQVLESVRAHFQSEEEEMEHYGYPHLDSHRQQHETFMRRLIVLRAECDGGDEDLIMMFAESLENWLAAHERTADNDVLTFLGLKSAEPH